MEEVAKKLNEIASRVILLDAIQIAEEAGSPITAGIVMLGALFGIGQLPIKVETVKAVIQAHFPAKLASINARAFDLGYHACQ